MKNFSTLLTTRRIYRSDELDEMIRDSGILEAKRYKEIGGTRPKKGEKKPEIYNVPCAFDIETTSFYEEGKKRAIMYIWMLGINGLCMTGRTWDEFLSVCAGLTDRLGLGDDRQLWIYVHNLEFEFQWIRHRFTWKKVFATGPRTPAYALTEGGLCFRCSYILSGYSLASVGRSLTRYKVEKAVGDLDYRVIRNSLTELTEAELNYCISDIKVVMAYIQEHIENDGGIHHVLITKTSYVRKYCRNACYYTDKSHKKGGRQHQKYYDMIHALQLTPEEYKLVHRAFQGGFTHASYNWSGKTLENVASYDLTSAYPHQMIAEKFPMSSGQLVEVKTTSELKKYLKCYCCIFDIEFHGLVAKDNTFEHPISVSKCWKLDPDHIEDNGRLVEAAYLRTTITNVDYEIYEQFYTWESISIGKFYIYRRGYLPRELILAILELYRKKTELKEVVGAEQEYMLSKENINACY